MGLISEIEGAEHTFVSWAEKEWTALYKEAPEIENLADLTLQYVGPALQIAATAEAGNAAGELVGEAVKAAQTKLTAVSGLITDFGATTTAQGVLTTVSSDLSTILSTAGIKNPTTTSAITKAVSSVTTLAAAVGNAVAAAKTPAA